MCHPNERQSSSSQEDDDQVPYRYNGIPEQDAGLLSQLLFVWVRPLFQRASYLRKHTEETNEQDGNFGGALEHEDLLHLPPVDHSTDVGQRFEEGWKAHSDKDDPSKKAGRVHANTLEEINKDSDSLLETKRLRHTILHVVGRPFVVAGFIKAVNSGLQFTFPILIRNILRFIEDTQDGTINQDDPGTVRYRGYWLSALLFAAMFGKAVTENQYFQRVIRAGYQTRVAVSVAVYDKALRLANAERQSTTLGQLVNLMQVDATKLEMMMPQVHVLWDGILQIVGYMAILYSLIGWPCFAGLFVMMFAGPVQGQVMKRLFGLNRKVVQYTDSRVKTTNEALQGISSVKMYTWEESFQTEIGKYRGLELYYLRAVAYLRGFSRAYMTSLPGIVAVASFVVYALQADTVIRASTLFAALNAFEQLRFPLLFYPVALAQWAQARVSGARVQIFLSLKEVGKGETTLNGTYSRDETKPGAVSVKDATIYWNDPHVPIKDSSSDQASTDDNRSDEKGSSVTDEETNASTSVYPKPVLKNISFDVSHGALCAVVGRVSSGKTSLCAAVLNESILESGEISLHGKVAYAAQSPWVMNATLRDNILFGRPMDKERYDNVIKACQLKYDFDLLEHGDLTEIGERGVNLSGGQKHRVSIARAAYSDADTVILDDPLSALDPGVGRQLFDHCIRKLMDGRTRILVTNNLQFLSDCDKVVALRNREVAEQGTYDELMSDENSPLKRLLDEIKASKKSKGKAGQSDDKNESENSKNEEELEEDEAPASKENNGLVTKEERRVGGVAFSEYRKYVQAGGGWWKFSIVYMGFILSTANQIGTTSWVSFWTSDPEYEKHSRSFYLGMYFALAVTLGVVTFARSYLLARFGVKAGENLHEKLFGSILKAPQSFFDTTPLGRIISRFSKDLYSIDNELPQQLDFFLFTTMRVVASLGSILFVTPYFGIAVLPLTFFYLRVLNYFRQVSRETKRLDSISRSPVYGHFSETLDGLPTIRSYSETDRFMRMFKDKVDENTRANYCNRSADRWLSVRLEAIGAMIAGLAAVFASNVAIENNVSGPGSESNFASLAGLSLTYAVSLTGLLNFSVRSFAQLEASMNSVERASYYSEEIPQEAPGTADDDDRSRHARTDGTASELPPVLGGRVICPPKDWPEGGAITLNNLRMRYRDDTPLVLKGLNVEIKGGERVGVVGRTGSGKSSLLLALLRMTEPYVPEDEEYVPPITIDGVDIMRIGLKELRTRIGIIPQTPALFSGTIRSNVDPFEDYSDEQIWEALEQCGLKNYVEEMPNGLLSEVSEYGENLSAGTRQMLVLGRVLLRQCRILCLDEATAAVDLETDDAIQRTIREAFKGCTVITIAHRINTIQDSDKILVVDDGLAAEFGSPSELLDDKNSLFSEIVHQSKTG